MQLAAKMFAVGVIISASFAVQICAAAERDPEAEFNEIMKAAEPPDVPKVWDERDPAAAEVKAFLSKMADAAAANADHARTFAEKYPKNRHASEARLVEARQLAVATYFGKSERREDLRKAKAALQAGKLADDERFFVETGVAYRLDYLEQSKTGVISLPDFEKEVRTLQQQFKNSADVDELLLDVAKAYFGRDQFDKAKALAQEVYDSKTTASLKETAHSIIHRAGLVGRPLALSYAALDGRKVDLTQLRGKVVLIDAWSTTCTRCIEKLPELKQIYGALRPKGLEIVGLNFDENRATVEKFVSKERISWPHYFDGNGWENKYGKEFEIVSLPALWLVDKKGIVRDLNAHERTRQKIDKLLAE